MNKCLPSCEFPPSFYNVWSNLPIMRRPEAIKEIGEIMKSPDFPCQDENIKAKAGRVKKDTKP